MPYMQGSSRWRLVGIAFLAVILPMARGHAQRRASERVTLVVEVIDRDGTPIIPCGQAGAQPRDVTARVISVEEGAFPRARILLRWPMCELVTPGQVFRIHIRRWTGVPDTDETRFRVRGVDAVIAP